MEPLTPVVRLAAPDCAEELADVAAQTFRLACPPTVDPADVATFIDANLSAARFADYLTDPRRAVLTAGRDDRILGYAMLIRGSEDDTAELSKMYVQSAWHGAGVAAALMDLALATAERWGVTRLWLGVNQQNQRAQRFYAKSGFTITGTRTFQVGGRLENDYVMTRAVVG